ncbi:hypothetical protein RYX36_002557 [Vicia faba]
MTFYMLSSVKIMDYFRGKKLDRNLLSKFTKTLSYIIAFVDDAEQRQIRNRHAKAWLDAVTDVMLDAEDLLDEINI